MFLIFNSAISEIANAIEIACANENVIAEIPTAGLTIPVTGGSGTNQTINSTITGATNLSNELTATVGASFTTSSRTYRAATSALAITVTVDGNGNVTVTAANWADEVDTPTATHTF